VRPRQNSRSLPPLAVVRERAVFDPCCHGDLGHPPLQINVICLLALIGTTAIMKHPAWFDDVPAGLSRTVER
jgi:hypothetical protein